MPEDELFSSSAAAPVRPGPGGDEEDPLRDVVGWATADEDVDNENVLVKTDGFF